MGLVAKIKHNKKKIELILMILLSVMIQALTLYKTSVSATIFGASSEMDAFNFSNNFSSFLFGFITAGIPTIVIPWYVKEKNISILNAFLTVLFFGLFLILGILIVFRNPIIILFTGRNSEFIRNSANILIVLLVSYFFAAFSNVTLAYFQCKEKYILPKIITFVTQFIVVVLLLAFKDFTIFTYSVIISSGLILNFIIDLVFAIAFGWRFKIKFSFDKNVRSLFKSFIPIIFSTGIYRLSLMVDTTIASRLNAGDLTLLSYGNQISNMINTLFVVNLLIFFYPKLVESIKNKYSHNIFWDQTYFMNSVMCLLFSGFYLVGKEGISLFFEHGKFDNNSASVVYELCSLYVLGQTFSIIVDNFYRFFYANENTLIPSINSCIIGGSNIIISIILSFFIGIYGIVIGTLTASILSMILIMFRFKKYTECGESIFVKIIPLIKNFCIMIVTITFVIFSKKLILINSNILSVLVFGTESVVIYFCFTYVLNKDILFFLRKI